MAGRYAHAKQFKRHHRELRLLRSRLGRIIRDIGRKIEEQPALEEAFAAALSRASQIRSQQQRQRGWKLYSFHAPEVECIGKGKARAPYEFGVKASIVTTNARAPGGQFVLHATALPGNPYDGHTLGAVIDATEKLTGCAVERGYVYKGYRGHNAANPRRMFISGQKRGVFGVIKRELRRRSAIEAVIGHMKSEGHLGRCYLKGRAGDAANVIVSRRLSAASWSPSRRAAPPCSAGMSSNARTAARFVSPTIPAAIGTAPSAKGSREPNGWPIAAPNFCQSRIFISSSPCRPRSQRSPCRTRRSSTISSSKPRPRRSAPSVPIPNISAPRSA